MSTTLKTNDALVEENERLCLRLEEAEAVIEAIRSGIVDAVVVNSPAVDSVYTLEGADRPYRLLVEAMQQGIAVLNADGMLLYCNPCLADLFKMSVKEAIGSTVDGFVTEADHSIWTDMLWNVESTCSPKEVRLRRSDGTTFPAALALSALPLRKFCLLVTDLSQQEMYEELVESKAALADLDRRKDEFLAMLGHELRNPLAPITNALQLLSLQKNEGELQHQARVIITRQVGQLTRLIDDLLEVSRITTGRIHIKQERVGLNGLVERALETARPVMDHGRHELTVSLSPFPIWLYADIARLEQVVVNLLNNAAKYTPDGGCISLTVQQEGDEAVLRVRDTGVGIAPDLLPRIFDLFTQAERSLDRSQGGLGIGLSLVHRLVEMHGGKVEAFSELGHGSEFVVRLPVLVTPAPQPPPVSKNIAEPNGPSLRVLVVDDNVDAVESLGLLLQASGHDVRTAYDGPSALEVAFDFRPNLVLLDIGLPGIDGFEVAKRLRQEPDISNAVLVAMTGYGQATDRQRSQEAGFNYHLVKPADFGNVQQILATISEEPTYCPPPWLPT